MNNMEEIGLTTCQIRDLTQKIELNNVELETMRTAIQEKNFYFVVLMVVAVIATTLCFCIAFQRDSYRDGAIKRGYMMYNPTNAQIQWVEGLTPKQ